MGKSKLRTVLYKDESRFGFPLTLERFAYWESLTMQIASNMFGNCTLWGRIMADCMWIRYWHHLVSHMQQLLVPTLFIWMAMPEHTHEATSVPRPKPQWAHGKAKTHNRNFLFNFYWYKTPGMINHKMILTVFHTDVLTNVVVKINPTL